MNKTFKILAALLAALMLAALALPALADVIIEPENNDFYNKHADDCVHDSGAYYVPKSEDGIKVFNEPNGKETASYPYGERFYSVWYYTDTEGNNWRCCTRYEGDTDSSFWFREAETLRVYDYSDFTSEHQAEFFDDAEEYRDISKVAFYEFPNGPFKYTEEFGNQEGIHFGECWKDKNGKTWGFLGYLYGRRNAWICLDDPENEGLTAEEVPLIDPSTGEKVGVYDPSVTPAPNATHSPDERKGDREDLDPNAKPINGGASRDGGKTGLIIGIVAGAAAVCAAVLALLFKKKKTGE